MKRYNVIQCDASGCVLDDTIVLAADVWEATGIVMLDHTRYPTTEWISVQLLDGEAPHQPQYGTIDPSIDPNHNVIGKDAA